MSCYPRNGSVADPGSPLLFLYHPKQQSTKARNIPSYGLDGSLVLPVMLS